jgi:tetratricopeptide (TPR) repeat protein
MVPGMAHPRSGSPRRGSSQGRPRPGPSQVGAPRKASHPRSHPKFIDEIRATAKPGQAESAVKAFEHAVDLLDRGRDAPAIAAASEAKALAPRSGAVREILGIALYRSGRFREALSELQAYRRMTGRLDQNHLVADCHRALGAPDKAVGPAMEALRSIASDEVRAEAAVVGASALADLGRYQEALGLLRGFRPKGHGARDYELRVWYVAGDIMERAGMRDEAAAEFRRVVRHDPGVFDAAERLAALTG